MTNDEISEIIKLYARLYELNGGNPFKIKSYNAASFKIDKTAVPLAGKSEEELEGLDGIGKSLASKIYEINATGSFEELNDLLQETPEGVLQILQIKGLGPKKVQVIWKELGIESIGELLYACHENRLAQAKGFGLKTQQAVIQSIEFATANAHKFHYATVEQKAMELLNELTKLPLVTYVSFTGALRRKCEVLDELEFVLAGNNTDVSVEQSNLLENFIREEGVISGKLHSLPVKIYTCPADEFALKLFNTTAAPAHLQLLPSIKTQAAYTSEAEIYNSISLPYIEPELREGTMEMERAGSDQLPKLIELSDLRGSLHNHSTWSDGLNTLEEMALACRSMNLEYFGICDHSKTAFYASGLKEEQIIAQHKEIDELNKKLAPFKIFKGIESDILGDGSLDYSREVLATFDFVVASVHSNLKMTLEKAMSRLLPAIENPYTTILGHPTGRLLLVREGYPVDHKKMIDACAANGVVIELNAHPYRLDLDWRWIDYALNKGVKISINPDAHNTDGFNDMYYGICVARKGFLTKEMCFNAMNLEEISAYFAQRKARI
ncbi:MAG: PHP domain-containing protein [Bacteroidia bacterium]|nr:PHP domain-containing protein [Bacteroidia bacterium]